MLFIIKRLFPILLLLPLLSCEEEAQPTEAADASETTDANIENTDAVTSTEINWLTNPNCLSLIKPIVLMERGFNLYQCWQIKNDGDLWGLKFPEFGPLTNYRKSVENALGPQALEVAINERPDTSLQSSAEIPQSNFELIKNGFITCEVRPVTCLEAHLVNYQATRLPMSKFPTQFHSFILLKNDSLKIYFTSSDQPVAPSPAKLMFHVAVDTSNGWNLIAHLNNSHIHKTKVRSGISAPSRAMAFHYQAWRDRFFLRNAFITNGYTTTRIPSGSFRKLFFDIPEDINYGLPPAKADVSSLVE